MKAVDIKKTKTIEIDTSQLAMVDNTLSLQGEGAGSWYYVGGILSGSTFRAMEMTGGIARNADAPDHLLVSVGVYDKFGLNLLPSSLSRSETLARTYDLAEQLIARNIEVQAQEILDRDSNQR